MKKTIFTLISILIITAGYFIFVYEDNKCIVSEDNIVILNETIILPSVTEEMIQENKEELEIILDPIYATNNEDIEESIDLMKQDTESSFIYDLKRGKPYVIRALNDLLELHLSSSLDEMINEGDNDYETYLALQKEYPLLFQNAEMLSFILESKDVFLSQDRNSDDPDRTPIEERLEKADNVYEEMLTYSLLTTSKDDFFDYYNQMMYDF